MKDCNVEDFGSETFCGKLTENDLPFAYGFNEQYAIGLSENEINRNTFCFTAYEKDNHKIVGLLGVSNEPIESPNQSISDTSDSEWVFHKIEYVVADKRLFTNNFWKYAFNIVLLAIVNIENGKKEVVWFDCQGGCVLRVIDCGKLKIAFEEWGYPYFFINEAEYFASHLLGENCRKMNYSEYEHSFSYELLKDFEEGRIDGFDTETMRDLIYGYTFTVEILLLMKKRHLNIR